MKLSNAESTPIDVISEQLKEPRPLPMGVAAFHEWSDRIISGALLPKDHEADEQTFIDSQKFALADLLMHVGPTESHKSDAHFIHSLRVSAIKQIAHAMRIEIRDRAKARMAEMEEAAAEVAAELEEIGADDLS